eukprot:Awhi_evm1s259
MLQRPNNCIQTQSCPWPVISEFGQGCDDGDCIWVRGTGFVGSCTTVLYDVNWVKLTEVADTSCDSTSAGFRIPGSILQANSQLYAVIR